MSTPDHATTATRGAWLTYGAALTAGAAVPVVPPLLGGRPSGIVAAAGLLLVAACCLWQRVLLGSAPAWTRSTAPAVAAIPGVMMLGIVLLPVLYVMLLAPLYWLAAIWTGAPAGLGLAPPAVTVPSDIVFAHEQAVAIAIAAAAAGTIGYAVRRTRSALVTSAAVVAPLALPLALVASDAPWPAVPLSLVVIGGGLVGAAAIAPLGPFRRGAAGIQGFTYVLSGLLGCLPTRATTVLALAVATGLAVVAAAIGRPEVRTHASILAVVAGAVMGAAGGLAILGSRPRAAFGLLAVAIVALVVAAATRAARPFPARATEASAHVVAAAAVAFTLGALAEARLVCALWTVATAARVLWPATPRWRRRFLSSYAAGWGALTWCLLLGQPQSLSEPYTLPFAVPPLIYGWAARRHWPGVRPLTAYGPGVLLAVGPTLLIALNTGDEWRYAALAVLAAVGAVLWLLRRRRVPARTGGV
jgi:hypothetical protein